MQSNLALSKVIYEVRDVGAKLEKDRTLQVQARVVRFFLKIFRGSSSAFISNPLPGIHRRAARS